MKIEEIEKSIVEDFELFDEWAEKYQYIIELGQKLPPLDDKYKIEVETSNLIEVDEALANKVDIIMLDNMQIEVIKESVLLINKKAITEVSGNITEEKLIMLGEIGIDYISSGALTHSVKALDISGKINIGD